MDDLEHQIQKGFSYRQIGSITHTVEAVPYPFTAEWLHQRFDESPEALGIPVEQDGSIIGVLHRDALAMLPESLFGNVREKDLKQLLGTMPKSIHADDFIESVFDRELEHENGHIGDFYLVYHRRSFMGVVAFEQLVNRINKLRSMDLEKAKEVQDHLLSLAASRNEGFKLGIFNKMAGRVGGDFYVNFGYNNDKNRFIGCFDVSGKGLAASLNTTVLGAFFSAFKYFGGDKLTPNRITTNLDSFVRELSPEGVYTAAAMAYLDFEKGKAYLQNCGLAPVYLFVPTGDKNTLKVMKPNLPPLGLGNLTDNVQTFVTVDIQKGLRVVMFTDGFTDMRESNGTMYGEERAHDFIVKSYSEKQDTFMQSVQNLTDEFQGKAPQTDDITLIDLRF